MIPALIVCSVVGSLLWVAFVVWLWVQLVAVGRQESTIVDIGRPLLHVGGPIVRRQRQGGPHEPLRY